MTTAADPAYARAATVPRGPSPSAHRLPSALRTPSFPGGLTAGPPLTPHRFSPGGSLHSTEDPLVLEIGSKQLRAGFANEGAPRCVIPWTEELFRRAGDIVVVDIGAVRRRRELWSLRLDEVDLGLVADLVERALRESYNKYLLIDSKTKKIILPVPPLLPTKLLSTVVSTIFTHFQPPSLTIMSAPVLATVAAGLRSALVVDIGWHETVVTPVYELRAIEGRGVGVYGRSRRGIKVLRTFWQTFLEAELEKAGLEPKIDTDEVEEVMERIGWCQSTLSSPSPNMFDVLLTTTTPPTTIQVPFDALAIPAEKTFFAPTTTPSSTPDVPDDDDTPLPNLLYNVLLHSTVDVRAACLSRVVVVGGGSRILGIQKRIVDELREMVKVRGWTRSRTRPLKKKPVPLPPEPSTPRLELPESESEGDGEGEGKRWGEGEGRSSEGHEEASDWRDQPPSPTRRDREARENARVKGEVRGVRSLGVWAGGSLLGSVRVKGKIELEREKFLAAVAGGATGFPAGAL